MNSELITRRIKEHLRSSGVTFTSVKTSLTSEHYLTVIHTPYAELAEDHIRNGMNIPIGTKWTTSFECQSVWIRWPLTED